MAPQQIDGLLVQWGDRLFYPGNRMVRSDQPRFRDPAGRARALRERIAATVVRRAPQVMVKVTGGGRGMQGIAAHLRYISKNGRLDMEDEQGQRVNGKDAVREIADDWRYGGSRIAESSDRREALNIILSMPRGTDPLSVHRAAREFAQQELEGHKYVMVLHDHQANPHVHISVRVESKRGRRLNPRKADLHRWRETFAEKLRGWGIDAEATRQATRGVAKRYPELWSIKAEQGGRLKSDRSRPVERGASASQEATQSWEHIAAALAQSMGAGDRHLSGAIRAWSHSIQGQRSRDPRSDVQRHGSPVRSNPDPGPSLER